MNTLRQELLITRVNIESRFNCKVEPLLHLKVDGGLPEIRAPLIIRTSNNSIEINIRAGTQ